MKEATKHLKGDRKTWEKLSKKAKEEAKDDTKLIKHIKKAGKSCPSKKAKAKK